MTVFDWDSKITAEESSNFALLEPGVYPFTVTKFERGQFIPSATSKIRDVCAKATYTLTVEDAEHGLSTDIRYTLFLDSSNSWKITQFFKSIGLFPTDVDGREVAVPWTQAEGCKGHCELGVHEYVDNTGTTRQANDIKRCLPPTTNEPVMDYGRL